MLGAADAAGEAEVDGDGAVAVGWGGDAVVAGFVGGHFLLAEHGGGGKGLGAAVAEAGVVSDHL